MSAKLRLPPAADLLTFLGRRRVLLSLTWAILIVLFLSVHKLDGYQVAKEYILKQPPYTLPKPPNFRDGRFHWQNLPVHYPVTSLIPLPTGVVKEIPQIQHEPTEEDPLTRAVRVQRLAAIKEAFQHAWNGYKNHAWLADEVGPLSGDEHNNFGGWAATLVDALDTLWIMDMKEEFAEAVKALIRIDFTSSQSEELNIFETTIRFLGGLLGAYDISNGEYPILLYKAMEVAEMLLVAFDTPNRMPISRWDWSRARDGEQLEAHENVLAAEIGSLTLEFTRLTQITGDARYYDAVQRIMDHFDEQQMETKLPGMWPLVVNARIMDFRADNRFTLGAMSDSLYEYLPKQHILLGAQTEQYKKLYENAATVFTEQNFYRPMIPGNADILFSGLIETHGDGTHPELEASMQHLVCFAGGMVALAAKIFSRAEDLDTAKRLVDGCIWAYASLDNAIMAEASHHVACPSKTSEGCKWDEALWHAELMKHESDRDRASSTPYEERLRHKIEIDRLVPGYVSIDDRRYILRPEAIESIFVWYRINGDRAYRDKAWAMFLEIEKYTRTYIANAALDDVTRSPPTQADRMESFWMAETLKYFYLTFAEPSIVSLDEFVFNTEAHPLRRPKQ